MKCVVFKTALKTIHEVVFMMRICFII